MGEGVMTNLQISWIALGLIFGLVMIIPVRRCLATHNGILSMLIASLMGIFSVPYSWVAVVLAMICFSYGFYQNHQKYIGVTNDEANRT